jgi:glutamate---cysteine ligase / carboxylate-amine ligase
VSAGSDLDLRTLTSAQLEAAFESAEPLTVGIEEEVMLLDPQTFDLWPGAGELLGRLRGDPRFKPELPASQLEILTAPTSSAEEALASLAAGRQDLVNAASGQARPAAAGVHPFSPAMGELNSSERYGRIRDEYGGIARRQLVAALQVHVSIGGADRTLRVYNALRGYLPEIAALAANAPIYEGRDTGLASVRPKIAELLPRQGMPPAIESWAAFAGELRWGAVAGVVGEPRLWWWELRPHADFGTLEVRVPDAQTSLADAGAVVGFVHCLAAWLCERHDGGEELRAVPTWRIEENRWSAARYGVAGRMADLQSGETEPTRERLLALMDGLEPVSRRLGSTALLDSARQLAEENGASRQREAFESAGAVGLTAWLADRFLAGDVG